MAANGQVLADALVRIGKYVADYGLMGEGPYKSAPDLLLIAAPRTGGEALKEAGETNLAPAMRLASCLQGVLPIQGPLGAGKTHIGARMICTLTQAGKCIILRNFLNAVDGRSKHDESDNVVSSDAQLAEHMCRLSDTAQPFLMLGPGPRPPVFRGPQKEGKRRRLRSESRTLRANSS